MSDITTKLIRQDGDLVAHSVQDVEPILERNHYLRSAEQKSDWGKHIAAIPMIFMEKWLNEEYARGNVDLRLFTRRFDNEVVRRKLNDPEYKWLRVDGPSSTMGWTGGGSGPWDQ